MFSLEDFHACTPCRDQDYAEPSYLARYDDILGYGSEPNFAFSFAPPAGAYPLFKWFRPNSVPCQWTLQGKLSVLVDWGVALFTDHDTGVVHGNLTPESVGVVHGRGVLIDQKSPRNCGASITKVDSDNDVCSARWAATELFRLDNGNPVPTQMSDVYSFACLMLQMLTGRVPYCGTKRPEQVVYLKYLGREPIDGQTPKVADRYVKFMRWCWSPEPEERPTMKIVVAFIREEIKRLG